jgi:hypothetical protein
MFVKLMKHWLADKSRIRDEANDKKCNTEKALHRRRSRNARKMEV